MKFIKLHITHTQLNNFSLPFLTPFPPKYMHRHNLGYSCLVCSNSNYTWFTIFSWNILAGFRTRTFSRLSLISRWSIWIPKPAETNRASITKTRGRWDSSRGRGREGSLPGAVETIQVSGVYHREVEWELSNWETKRNSGVFRTFYSTLRKNVIPLAKYLLHVEQLRFLRFKYYIHIEISCCRNVPHQSATSPDIERAGRSHHISQPTQYHGA
jgi:hypothetical protein